MGKSDISFKNDELQVKFNFRVACIVTGQKKILIQKNFNDDYYSIIGGRVKFFEDTTEALIREINEETGITISRDEAKLIDIVENFFIYDNTKFHEILFIYKVEENEKLMMMDNFKTIDKNNSINLWVDIKELNKYKIMPTIVKKIIDNDKLNHEIIKDY